MADNDLRDLVLEALQEQQEKRSRGEITENELEEFARGIPALFDIPPRTWAAWKAHNTRGTYKMNSLQKETRMKALLVTNCSTGEVDIISSKLSRYGVEIARVISADRGLNVSVLPAPEVPLVIALVERMSGGQIQKVKDLAANGNRAYVGLRSKSSGWETDFSKVLPEFRAVNGTPNSTRTPQSLGSMATVFPPHLRVVPEAAEEEKTSIAQEGHETELVKLFEEENAKLEAKNTELTVWTTALEAQKDDLIERLRKADEEIRHLRKTGEDAGVARSGVEKLRMERDQSIQQIRKANEEAEKQAVEVRRVHALCQQLELKLSEMQAAPSADELRNMERECATYRETNERLSKELDAEKDLTKRQGTELYRLREAAKNASPPNSTRTTVKANEDFTKVRDAFKTLWRTGAMKGDDILKTLMEWEPKES